jgi:hypothetical protein
MIGSFLYGTSTVIPMTLTSLASSTTVGWMSAAIDNTTDCFVDAIVQVRFRLLAGTVANDQLVFVHVFASEDGTNFTDAIVPANATYTARIGVNMMLLQAIVTTSGNLVHVGHPTPLSTVFSGVMPRKWGIFIRNYCGIAFTATASDHVVTYTGLKINTV